MNAFTLRPLHAAFLSLTLAASAVMAAPESSIPRAASSAVSAGTGKSKALAEKPASSAAQQAHRIFRDEMAFCASGQSTQGRPVCEQEARAAHAQNLRGALADGGKGSDTGSNPNYSQNAQQRCQLLPAVERSGCLMRARGKAAPGEVLVVPGSEAPLQATTPPRQ